MTDFVVKFDENPSIDVAFKDVTVETKKPTLEKVEATISVNDHYSYTPSDGYDGISKIDIDVDVPDIPPILETTTVDITNNGTMSFFPSKGYDGISRITARVNVPTPPPRLELKYVPITKNGTTVINPSEGYDGLGSINISVKVADTYHDAFWDSCQQNGERVNYNYGFAYYSWNDITFKPKYDIRPTSAQYIFSNTAITDLAKLLDDAGVVLDTSQAPNLIGAFASTKLTHIPTISLENCTKPATTSMLFYVSRYLVTIDKIIINRDTNIYSNAFVGLNALENIRFDGEIGMSINLGDSPNLTSDSVDSIGNATIDLTGLENQTVTFNKAVIERMTDEQKAVFTNKNWTIASKG